MGDATFTFRVDEALKSAFSDAAKAHDRTGAQLIRDFMRSYVADRHAQSDHDAWFRQQVHNGRASADAGNLLPDAEIEAEAETWREEMRRKMAGQE